MAIPDIAKSNEEMPDSVDAKQREEIENKAALTSSPGAAKGEEEIPDRSTPGVHTIPSRLKSFFKLLSRKRKVFKGICC